MTLKIGRRWEIRKHVWYTHMIVTVEDHCRSPRKYAYSKDDIKVKDDLVLELWVTGDSANYHRKTKDPIVPYDVADTL